MGERKRGEGGGGGNFNLVFLFIFLYSPISLSRMNFARFYLLFQQSHERTGEVNLYYPREDSLHHQTLWYEKN